MIIQLCRPNSAAFDELVQTPPAKVLASFGFALPSSISFSLSVQFAQEASGHSLVGWPRVVNMLQARAVWMLWVYPTPPPSD